MKIMTLNGITVEVESPIDQARLFALGYRYVEETPAETVAENKDTQQSIGKENLQPAKRKAKAHK